MRLGGQDVAVKPDTLAWRLFGRVETVRLRFHIATKWIEIYSAAGQHGLLWGKSPAQPIMQILELPGHPRGNPGPSN